MAHDCPLGFPFELCLFSSITMHKLSTAARHQSIVYTREMGRIPSVIILGVLDLQIMEETYVAILGAIRRQASCRYLQGN